MKLQSGSNAITMAVSILAIGLAVASTSRASDAAATDADASTVSGTTSSARPDRAKVEAAMKTCRESAGIAEGTRPTQAQHETIHACMTAAGFDRPPGPPRDGAGAGPRDGRGHHGPPPDGLGAGARARPPAPARASMVLLRATTQTLHQFLATKMVLRLHRPPTPNERRSVAECSRKIRCTLAGVLGRAGVWADAGCVRPCDQRKVEFVR